MQLDVRHPRASLTSGFTIPMFRQPALAGSALQGLHDELVAYMTLFCSPQELLALAQVNSVFYVFAREEPLWMLHCLQLHGGDFTFFRSWRLTTFFPRVDTVPKHFPVEFPTLHVRDFGSDFLYRRWCRSHMSLDQFLPPTDALARRIHRFNVEDLSYQDFFEQFARVPFILHNAIGKWNASSQWSVPQLATRFPDARHRLTHNLDTTSDKATQMTFADYRQYLAHQHDETPLYIFDPRFGEKMPELLNDYRVDDLKVFQEDLVQQVSQSFGDPVTNEIKDTIPRPMRSDFRWIVIGPQRSGAPWHTDPARTSAWNALVQGRKRWALYPPGTPPPGISVGKNAAGRNHALDMTSLAWYLHVYPTLPPHQRPLEVVQEPGDVIYVPSGWWHLVLNLDETVAVTQNFVDSHNLVMFVNDLLDDQQDEALQMFQHAYSKHKLNRPEIVDVCRVLQIPRRLGFLSGEMYLTTFRDLKLWRPRIKKVLTRHKLPRGTSPTVRNLTARVNPAFAVDAALLVKFFSELNQDWGEFDFTTFLTPEFDLESAASPSKKRKTSIVPAHALKKAMTLRFAMEESFRIERATYQMLMRVEDAALRSMVPTFHVAGHLLDVSEVDENDEDDESGGGFWRWPYVVMEFKHGLVGISRLVKHGGGASMESWQRLSAWVNGEFVPRLHAVEIDERLVGLHVHSKKHWDWYEHYLLRQRKRALAFHLKEDAIPPQLMNVLEQFLPAATPEAMLTLLPAAGSAARAKPVLLHGDLTDENVLGTASSLPCEDVSPEKENDTDADALASWLETIGCASAVDKLVHDAHLTKRALALLGDNHLRQLGVPPGITFAIRAALEKEQQLGSHQPWLGRTDASDSDSDEEDEDEDDGINEFLASPAQLESARTSRLKQFYGEVEWIPGQVIDFADAKTGDPLYDLVAIFFSALHCDPELWHVAIATPYWQNYLTQQQAALQCDAQTIGRLVRERLLRLTLLHPSRSIKSLFHFFPHAVPLSVWDQVAGVVFGDLFVPSSH